MKKLALIAALVLVPLMLAAPSVQAQTSPTNATANSQLANTNTANALGITRGVTTGITTTGQQQTSTSNRNPTTGVMCIQEITATFCNVPSGPNTNGYGSPGGAGSRGGTGSSGASGSAGGAGSAAASASGGGPGVNTSSIPTCGGFPSANELCN